MFSSLICLQQRSRCTPGSRVGWKMLRRAWVEDITKAPHLPEGARAHQDLRARHLRAGRLGWPEGGAFLDNLK